jgi:ABC-type Na+ transport system ATPase subunit NatA
MCDRLVLLSEGCVVAQGTVPELTALAMARHAVSSPPGFEEVFLALTE